MDPLIGKQIGHYVLRERLGEGGQAMVYRAEQLSLGRDVAIKIMTGPLASDEEFVKRFRREAMAAGGLGHPNIFTVYDAGTTPDGMHYIAMEYAPGGTLRDVLERGPLSQERAAELAAQIADALHAAHRHGIVHRDLKPSNILMARDGRPLLADFGVAQVGGHTRLTRAGVAVGTPEFMSPEQAQGLVVDERSDIYALGVMLFEMLTGSVPFSGETPLSTLYRHVNDPVPNVKDLKADLSPWLAAIVEKSLAKRPEDRFTNAAEMATALRAGPRGLAGHVDRPVAEPTGQHGRVSGYPSPPSMPPPPPVSVATAGAPARKIGTGVWMVLGLMAVGLVALGTLAVFLLAGGDGGGRTDPPLADVGLTTMTQPTPTPLLETPVPQPSATDTPVHVTAPSPTKTPEQMTQTFKLAALQRLEELDSYRSKVLMSWEYHGGQRMYLDIVTEYVQEPPAMRQGLITFDSLQTTEHDAADSQLEVILVDGMWYMREGGAEWNSGVLDPDEAGEAEFQLNDFVYWLSDDRGRLEGVETVNGVQARRYHLNRADLDLSNLEATYEKLTAAEATVWVSTDDEVMVKAILTVEFLDQEDGAGVIRMEISITDINRPIIISAPALVEARPTLEITPSDSGVWVLPNHSAWTSSIGTVWITGEVQNSTDDTLRYLQVYVSLLDSTGQPMLREYSYARLSNLPPGERTCFRVHFSGSPTWDAYQFDGFDYWTDGVPLTNLTIISHSGTQKYSQYEISGMIRNDKEGPLRNVETILTLYDSEGTVVGCDSRRVENKDLSPGQTSSFGFLSSVHSQLPVASYRLQPDARP